MNTNAAHQIPVHRQRHRISRQEMLRRKRAIRRRKRIARFFRISVAVLLLLTAVSFWQDYGGEILPTVNHLYYQLTARYDLPVSKYDFAALQEENETTFAESLSSVDADAENITEALSELVKNNAEAADFVADYPNRQIIWVSLSTSLTMSSSDRFLCSCNGTSVGAMCPSATASSVSPAVGLPACPWPMYTSPGI